MLKNYLTTAVRSLLRHRFFSAINIFGLAVAMSICMGIIMLVADQMGYDRHNTNADRIYRVNTLGVDDHGVVTDPQPNAASTMRLRQELQEKYTGIEKVVRIKRGFGNGWLEFENQNVNIPLAGFFADPEVLELFQYELQYGNAATALKEPYSVVLTRKAANKLFKEENPVGKTVSMGKTETYTITGVLKETENKSHMVFEGLASMASVKSLLNDTDYQNEMEDWGNVWNGWTYILLEKGKSAAYIQQHLDKIYTENIASIKNPGVYKVTFMLQSVLDITPGPITNNPIGPALPWVFVYFLGGLALVILLTSCFNFTNLSIARSLTRAREIGVRKVTGAARWQIFVQFISESIVVAMVALVIALGLMLIIKPMILQLNFARIFKWDLQANTSVYVIFFVFAAVVGILAGFFPAAVLSGFQPIKVLKSLNNMKLFSRMGLRKVLLVSQFTLSLFFILTVIVMYNQLNLFITKDHGFNTQNNIVVKLNNTKAETLKNELVKYNNVVAVSAASHLPAAGTSYGNDFKKVLTDTESVLFGYFLVDQDYVQNMNLKILAGRFFTGDAGANKDYLVVNEEAVKRLHLGSAQEAIGQEIIHMGDSTKKTIIGVLANYNHRDLFQKIEPMALIFDPARFNVLQVRFSGSYAEASKTLEKAWATVNPGLKIEYQEADTQVRMFYEIVFGDIVRVLGFVSFLAILISCLGLLGMATYATETRIKEISIRKVLGSSSTSLILLLSKGFLTMLGLAVLIGVPAAYFINNLWLQLIAYHTNVDITMVLIGVGILILFGVLTIGSQTIRATFVKPVENLKNE